MWDSESKKNAINEIVEKYEININESYAYGDTAGDFSMFQMVKYPVCVNPTNEILKKVLNDEELKKRIQIIVERKDVVYNLKPECINNF